MAINPAYTTAGELETLLKRSYQTRKSCLSFVEAVFLLNSREALLRSKPAFPSMRDTMSTQQFSDFTLAVPLDLSLLVGKSKNSLISEFEIIPSHKDVFVIKHLPYVDDKLHTHDYFELNYVYVGSCVQAFENETRILNQGDLCIISPDSTHNIRVTEGDIVVSILIRKSTFDAVFSSFLVHSNIVSLFFRNNLYGESSANFLVLATGESPELKKIIHKLYFESNLDDDYGNQCAVSLVNLLFVELLRRYSDTVELYDAAKISDQEFDFSLLLQYINLNYQTVTLSSLADEFKFNKFYLSKLIKKNLNQTLSEIVKFLKVSHAEGLLLKTNLSVEEISAKVGYASVDHFSRTFKKEKGSSPSYYRKLKTHP